MAIDFCYRENRSFKGYLCNIGLLRMSCLIQAGLSQATEPHFVKEELMKVTVLRKSRAFKDDLN